MLTHLLKWQRPGPKSLKDDDLAGRMGLQLKELGKVMAVLENDKLVRVCVTSGFYLREIP